MDFKVIVKVKSSKAGVISKTTDVMCFGAQHLPLCLK